MDTLPLYPEDLLPPPSSRRTPADELAEFAWHRDNQPAAPALSEDEANQQAMVAEGRLS